MGAGWGWLSPEEVVVDVEYAERIEGARVERERKADLMDLRLGGFGADLGAV